MKTLRNPINRSKAFNSPAGNVMVELKEAELNTTYAGAGEPRSSAGNICTSTAECNTSTLLFFCC